jgi:hypothetical protein
LEKQRPIGRGDYVKDRQGKIHKVTNRNNNILQTTRVKRNKDGVEVYGSNSRHHLSKVSYHSESVNEVSDELLHNYKTKAANQADSERSKSNRATSKTGTAKTASSVRRLNKVATASHNKANKRDAGYALAQRKQTGDARVNATEGIMIGKKGGLGLVRRIDPVDGPASPGRSGRRTKSGAIYKQDLKTNKYFANNRLDMLKTQTKNLKKKRKLPEDVSEMQGQPVGVHVHMKDKRGKVSKTTFLGTHSAVAGAKKHISSLTKQGHTLHKKELAFAEGIVPSNSNPEFKVGQKVTVTKGPHAGAVHKVIHQHRKSGSNKIHAYNVAPVGLDPKNNKYRLGAAMVSSNHVKESVEQTDEMSNRLLNRYTDAAKKDTKKDRTKGMRKARNIRTQRANKGLFGSDIGEEVEQVDELSNKKLASYVSKASSDAKSRMKKGESDGVSRFGRKTDKRMDGIDRALNKMPGKKGSRDAGNRRTDGKVSGTGSMSVVDKMKANRSKGVAPKYYGEEVEQVEESLGHVRMDRLTASGQKKVVAVLKRHEKNGSIQSDGSSDKGAYFKLKNPKHHSMIHSDLLKHGTGFDMHESVEQVDEGFWKALDLKNNVKRGGAAGLQDKLKKHIHPDHHDKYDIDSVKNHGDLKKIVRKAKLSGHMKMHAFAKDVKESVEQTDEGIFAKKPSNHIKAGETHNIGGTKVKFHKAGKQGHIGYSWKKSNGKEGYEEYHPKNHKNHDAVTANISSEIKYQAKHHNESVEQVDELSVDTLSRYNSKASKDPKRAKMNNKAVGKIVKKTMQGENVEQVDESISDNISAFHTISTNNSSSSVRQRKNKGIKTSSPYSSNSSNSSKVSPRYYNQKGSSFITPDEMNRRIKRNKKRGKNNESVEQTDEGIISTGIAKVKAGHYDRKANKSFKKAKGALGYGKGKSIAKGTSDEDGFSKHMKQSNDYERKAKKIRSDAFRKTKKFDSYKGNRKESVDQVDEGNRGGDPKLPAVKAGDKFTHANFTYTVHKTNSDSVHAKRNNGGTPGVFDHRYVQQQTHEATISDTGWRKAIRQVTDKSGAKHDPMARTKHAAKLGLKHFINKQNKAKKPQ